MQYNRYRLKGEFGLIVGYGLPIYTYIIGKDKHETSVQIRVLVARNHGQREIEYATSAAGATIHSASGSRLTDSYESFTDISGLTS
jgi:hypothetical protein